MKRSDVGIVIAKKPAFNPQAFEYFLLAINRIQEIYEFVFPDFETMLTIKGIYTEEKLIKMFQNYLQESNKKYEYWILIMNTFIEGDYFAATDGKISVITTRGWEKVFSPPSLFEYLVNNIAACLICMDPKIEIDFHDDTKGCLFDFNGNKYDQRVNIVTGYICDSDRKLIEENLGIKKFNNLEKMIDRKWIGIITHPNSVAYNLKHYFNVDILKNSGFNKSIHEKIFETFLNIPVQVILLLLGALITILLVVLGIKKL